MVQRITILDPRALPSSAKAKRLTKKQVEANERAEAIATLREMGVVEGSEITAIIVNVSRSGMRRTVRVLFPTTVTVRDVTTRPEPLRQAHIEDITLLVAKAIGDKCDKRGDIIVGGAGTDVRFLVVYHLSLAMFPNDPGVVYKDRHGKVISGGYVLHCNRA